MRFFCAPGLFNNNAHGISLNRVKRKFYDTVGEGLTLADGKTYHTGDLKPTWEQLKETLGINFESVWTGAGSAEKEFNVWKEKLNEVDM